MTIRTLILAVAFVTLLLLSILGSHALILSLSSPLLFILIIIHPPMILRDIQTNYNHKSSAGAWNNANDADTNAIIMLIIGGSGVTAGLQALSSLLNVLYTIQQYGW
jgi:hypothetical protein